MNEPRKKRAPSLVYFSPEQLSLDCFKTSFEQQLKKNNRWVVLVHLILWDEICNLYMKHVGISNTGRPLLSQRKLCTSDVKAGGPGRVKYKIAALVFQQAIFKRVKKED